MVLAETSASKTTEAAKLALLSARADMADAETESALDDVDETESHDRYTEASSRAARRTVKS